MRRPIVLCAVLAVTSWAGQAWAVQNSNRVEGRGTTAKAWSLVGDFCGIKAWHPAIANCTVADIDGAKVRTLTTKDGATFVEQLVKWDDKDTSYTYKILQSPLPVQNYVSTIKVEPDDEPGKVAITWSSTFEPKGASEDQARKAVSDIYLAGLLKLKSELKAK